MVVPGRVGPLHTNKSVDKIDKYKSKALPNHRIVNITHQIVTIT